MRHVCQTRALDSSVRDSSVQIAGWGAGGQRSKRSSKRRANDDDTAAQDELTDIAKTMCDALAKNLYNLSLVHPFVARDGETLRSFILRIGPPCGVIDAGFEDAAKRARDIRKLQRASKEIAQTSTMQDASKDLLAEILCKEENTKIRDLCALF